MIYITNTELDDSGSVRAIHSHRETAEIALVYQGHGAHKIDNRIYNSEPGDLLLYNTGILHQDLSSTGEEPMCFYLCGIRGLQLEGRLPGVLSSNLPIRHRTFLRWPTVFCSRCWPSYPNC